MRFILIVIAGLLLAAPSCRGGERASEEMPNRPISEVLDEHAPTLMDIEGVNSVGQGDCDGEPCISIGVVRLTEELRARIPKQIEGYRVRVFEQGAVRNR